MLIRIPQENIHKCIFYNKMLKIENKLVFDNRNCSVLGYGE